MPMGAATLLRRADRLYFGSLVWGDHPAGVDPVRIERDMQWPKAVYVNGRLAP